MALQKREKMLTLVTGAVLLAVGLPLLLSSGGGLAGLLRASRDAAQSKVADQQAQLDTLSEAQDRLSDWRKRSLPSDRELAATRYQTWLRKLVADVKLDAAKVDPKEPVSDRGAYWKLRFAVNARGTLEQLTRLLHGFYSADYLHQIRRLTITPVDGSKTKKLTLYLLIEALSLPGAEHQQELPPLPDEPDRLKKSLEEYLATIVKRRMEEMEGGRTVDSGGLFAAYVPPRPPPPIVEEPIERIEPPPPPGFDMTKFTVVSGITAEDGRPQVWLDVRPTGEEIKRYEGESFQIGEATGTVEKIETLFVSIQIHGEHRKIRLGNTLHEAFETSVVKPPEAEESETEESASEEPGTEEPETEGLETEEPDVAQTDATQPTPGEPEPDDLAATEPETEGPTADQPETEKPEPEAEEPVADEPDTKAPPADRPETEEPQADSPEIEQPEPETEQPESETEKADTDESEPVQGDMES